MNVDFFRKIKCGKVLGENASSRRRHVGGVCCDGTEASAGEMYEKTECMICTGAFTKRGWRIALCHDHDQKKLTRHVQTYILDRFVHS